MRDIGKNIKALREKKGMTQEALAGALFVTRQTVSNYATGRSRPDLDMLVKIAGVLEADVNQVLYGLPADQDLVREAKRLGIGCLILLGIFLLELPFTLVLRKPYVGWLTFLLPSLRSSALWLVLGWCSLQIAGLTRLVRPMEEQKWTRRVRRGLLILLTVNAVLFFPLLVVGIIQAVQYFSHSMMTFPQIPLYLGLMDRLLLILLLYPWIYFFPGGVLWLLRFPSP